MHGELETLELLEQFLIIGNIRHDRGEGEVLNPL